MFTRKEAQFLVSTSIALVVLLTLAVSQFASIDMGLNISPIMPWSIISFSTLGLLWLTFITMHRMYEVGNKRQRSTTLD